MKMRDGYQKNPSVNERVIEILKHLENSEVSECLMDILKYDIL